MKNIHKKMFTPITISNVEIKNRIAMAPHVFGKYHAF